jgi:ABC-type nitrate/sulfonate/bicarbonate transport system ATPase subunit
MDPGPRVLSAEALVVGRGSRALLEPLDLELRRGEVVAVLGPNGVGKSTLLATLAGLLPALGGRIERDGRVAAALQAPALARRSVRANVEAALAWWGVPRAERRARADEALGRLHAERLAERPAGELSGGEARRVHLARALALRADALLLDEPFAGLDAPTRAELLHDAASALRDPARATLLVLHDRAEAWALADRLLILLDGRLAAQGPPARVLERPPSVAVAAFLGFSGRIAEPGGAVRCLRPAQVALDPGGELAGVVRRRVPEEDAVLCEVDVEGGRVRVRAPHPGPAEGTAVRLRAEPGVRFARGQGS